MIQTIEINPRKDLYFDYKVIEMCKSCKRYGKKATCPPYVTDINYYMNLLPAYQYGFLYYKKIDICDDGKTNLQRGKESSLLIHNTVLAQREELFKEGHVYIIGFGAGSCKLCETCQMPCSQPEKSLIPLEATGLDLITVMERKRIHLKFPVKESFYRIGGIFYD